MLGSAFALVGVGAAACGAGATYATHAPPQRHVVNTATIRTTTAPGIGAVLVDGAGDPLYTPVQERAGRILCQADCTDVWMPLTLAAGHTPVLARGVTGNLGVVARPDGRRQVTFDGAPLYRFAFDPASGKVTGNGVSDAFSSGHFDWRVVTTQGVAQAAPTATGMGYGG